MIITKVLPSKQPNDQENVSIKLNKNLMINQLKVNFEFSFKDNFYLFP